MLLFQPARDTLGSVPLLFQLRLVVHQNLIDDAQPRIQLGPRHRLLSLISRRQRKLQHPPDRLAKICENLCENPSA